MTDSNSGNDSSTNEKEKARDYLLKWSNRKIEQHIAYIFALLGAFYTIINIPDSVRPIITKYGITYLLFSIISILLIYNAGRIVYWSVFHQYSLTHKPIEISLDAKNYPLHEFLLPNPKWELVQSVKDDIMNRGKFENLRLKKDEKTDLNTHISKIRRKMAMGFSGSNLLGSIMALIILWIVYFLCKLVFSMKS